MTFRIRYHPLASSDLKRIARYVADYAGSKIGEAKVDEIVTVIDSLADRPHRGTRYDEIVSGLRLLPASKKGSVAFTVDEKTRTVTIIVVSYAGQDWTRITRERQTP